MQELIERLFFLQQAGNTIIAEWRLLIRALFDGVERDMRRLDPTSVQARYRAGRRDALLAEVATRVKDALPRWRSQVKGDLAKLGRQQAVMVRRSLIATLGTVIDDELAVEVPITEQRMRAILNTEPFQGRTFKGQVSRLGANTVDRIGVQVRLGMAREESIDDIVRRVRGRRAGNGFVGGVMQATTREAEAVVRTAVTYASNRGMLDTFRANRDVLDRVRYVATLDDRTCFAAGTGVLTAAGYRPIESIASGDWVIGGSGQIRRVVATRSVKKSDMARVVLSSGAVVICTADHLWLTEDQEWVEAQDLAAGVMLAGGLDGDRALRGLRRRVRATAVEGESLLRDAVLPCRTEGRRLHRDPRAKGAVPHLREGPRAYAQQETRRVAGGPSVLLTGLLPQEALPACGLGLRWVREGGADDALSREASEVLLPRMSGCVEASGADQLPGLRGVLHADSDTTEDGVRGVQEGPHNVLHGMLLPVGERGRGAEAQDRRCVHRREASELDGRSLRHSAQPPWARMGEDRAEGAPERRLPLHRVREITEGGRGAALRPPHRAVPQLQNGARGEPHEQPPIALSLLPYEDRAPSAGPADGDPAGLHVVAVETYHHPTTVYDIQVEVDECFIVAAAVVHNSALCLFLDGKEWDLDDPEIVVPGEATHFNCRSVLIGIPAYDKLGLAEPPVPDRVARDMATVSDDALGRNVRTRRRRGEFGDVERVSSKTRAEQWLRAQRPAVQNKMLGRSRAELFRQGKLSLRDLVFDDPRTVSFSDFLGV